MLFLFRSAPEVEKRIHSNLFRKFWRSPGTKEPAYITVKDKNEKLDLVQGFQSADGRLIEPASSSPAWRGQLRLRLATPCSDCFENVFNIFYFPFSFSPPRWDLRKTFSFASALKIFAQSLNLAQSFTHIYYPKPKLRCPEQPPFFMKIIENYWSWHLLSKALKTWPWNWKF